MKRFGLTLVCLSWFVFVANAQPKGATPSNTCYDEYSALFRQRGGKTVPDGTHRIVVAFRPHQGAQQCFLGKIDVKNGELVPPVYVQKDDGSFEIVQKELDPALQQVPQAEKRKITDAASYTLVTTDGEFIRLFLIDFLADKPKANKVAPSAKSLQ